VVVASISISQETFEPVEVTVGVATVVVVVIVVVVVSVSVKVKVTVDMTKIVVEYNVAVGRLAYCANFKTITPRKNLE